MLRGLEFRRDVQDDDRVDSAALTDVGERLDVFADEVFSSLKRKDQRATAGVYARG